MKTIYMIYCVLITLAALSAPALAGIVGDADNDGRITTADSALVLQMSVGSVAPDIGCADVSGDGTISSLDALMILTIAQKMQVYVNAPEVVSGTFDATIDVYNAVALDSGQFDLTFNPSVVNVIDVYDGNIDGTTVPIDSWNFTDADTIRVLFNLPGVDDLSGSGQIATISFEITGAVKDTSVLDISDGLIVDSKSDETSALWSDCNVAIGVPVKVNSPEVATDSFDATIEIENVADMNGGQFDLSFDTSVVNVTDVNAGSIDGTTVPLLNWRFIDSDTIRVLFMLAGADGVSGSGYVAKIGFEMAGSQGDSCVLDISNGNLADTSANKIPATWNDCDVAIGVPVKVDAPETISGAFDATVDIMNVTSMNGGQFDLSFDSSVVNVTEVYAGNIGGTMVPIVDWRFMDSDTIRVIFKLSGDDEVSGSGYVVKIGFETTGSQGDTSILDISDGKLADTSANKIPATWTDDEVNV
ncbi:MAG: cohesin domain-containing protein [Euryarchaeota archaeon]|nr:cohesin domain-containing protein [Euryarchaeota archaeon]